MIAFSAAIPLLAALVLVNSQENFRRRVTDSLMVRVARSICPGAGPRRTGTAARGTDPVALGSAPGPADPAG
ncbi:MAG TPA: hypothetical protein VLJ88_03085 [Propionibacteriaceae bacterium]|nr:hypothetical protein [Propionibacteriaceae bacterium]